MADGNQNVPEIAGHAANEAEANEKLKHLSLDSVTLLMITEQLDTLKDNTYAELKELKQRQDKVSFLQKLLKTIDLKKGANGHFDCSNEADLQEMLAQAGELDVGIEQGKHTYNKEEREGLVERIRMTIDELNIKNEMQMQVVSRLTNQRYESYQMARTILKPMHDDKIKKARAIAGG